MRFRVRAQWRRPDGTVVGVIDEVTAGDACEALMSAWPTDADRPCSAATITIKAIGSAAIVGPEARAVPSAATDGAQAVEDHAAALLDRLQAKAAQFEPRARGHVAMAYPDVLRAYHDLIACFGWEPARWPLVSRELRRLTAGRKRYANGEHGKVVMYDIPVQATRQVETA